MKTSYLIVMFGLFGFGLYCGGAIEHRLHTAPANKRVHLLSKQVERFENPEVFSHAEYVAGVTGAPLYQVLTGKPKQVTTRKGALMRYFRMRSGDPHWKEYDYEGKVSR